MTLTDSNDKLEGGGDRNLTKLRRICTSSTSTSRHRRVGLCLIPAPIQAESLPYGLSDYDVTGQAQTGTGKTAAFLISIFTKLWEKPLQGNTRLRIPSCTCFGSHKRDAALQIESDAMDLSRSI